MKAKTGGLQTLADLSSLACRPTQAPTRRIASCTAGSRGLRYDGVSWRLRDGRGETVGVGLDLVRSGEGGGVGGRAIWEGWTM